MDLLIIQWGESLLLTIMVSRSTFKIPLIGKSLVDNIVDKEIMKKRLVDNIVDKGIV